MYLFSLTNILTFCQTAQKLLQLAAAAAFHTYKLPEHLENTCKVKLTKTGKKYNLAFTLAGKKSFEIELF